MEIIQAGVLGQIERVYLWSDYCGKFPPSHDRPAGEDPVPDGLNWDFWLGPCAVAAVQGGRLSARLHRDAELARPVQRHVVRPRRAYVPIAGPRAETRPAGPGHRRTPRAAQGNLRLARVFRFEYAARDGLAPVTLWWGDGGKYPPEEVTDSLKSRQRQLPNTGCLFVGQRGQLYTDGWGVAGIMKLDGDKQWRGVLNHEAVQAVPLTVPRLPDDNHMQEWFQACKGGPATYNGFEVGARVSEAYCSHEFSAL